MLNKLMDSPEELNSDSTLDQVTSRPTSRRALLAGGMTAAFTAAAGVASAQNRIGMTPQKGRPSPGGSNNGAAKPPVGGPGGSGGTSIQFSGSSTGSGSSNVTRFWGNVDKKLLRRINYGVTPEDIAEIESLGYDAYLEKQLNSDLIDDSACEQRIDVLAPRMRMDLLTMNSFTGSDAFHNVHHYRNALAIRAISSKRQLHQKMHEFWSDHFYIDEKPIFGAVADYHRGIHARALTTFRDLLVYSANHGAMMDYLDNRESTVGRINVNYAREILELHTVSVNGGYTEEDIYETANIFTGWWTPPHFGDELHNGIFEFKPEYKTPGSRTVMGKIFNQTGKAQGDAMLEWLAAHPRTIQHIATKLCQFFLGRNPNANLLVKIGEAWGTQGDIKAVLRVILHQSEIQFIQPKFKRPFHLVMGAMRQTGMQYDNVGGLLYQVYTMNHNPLYWGQPDGYPHSFAHWAAGIVPRINFALGIVNRQVWQTIPFDINQFTGMSDVDRMNWINERLFLGELPVSEQIWIRRYLKGSTSNERARAAVGIALSCPTYQWF